MRITIECDSGSGSAVSTVDQTQGALAAPVSVNAGAAPGTPGGGAEIGAAVGATVNAGAAPGAPGTGGAEIGAALGATVDAGAAPSFQKNG
jgi:hypothetical protein